MLAILSLQISTRFEYVCDVIFKRILGLDFVVLTDEKAYQEHSGFKLRYLPKSLILYEDNIHQQDEKLLLEDKPALAFYILTNYEEYLPDCPRDAHGRVDHASSFVVRHDLYQKPVIHDIANHYKSVLSKQQPDYQWGSRKYKFIPTFDVDIAYAYKGKRFFHFCGAFCKALLQCRLHDAKSILKAKFTSDFKDSYDTYSLPKMLCETAGLQPLYFLLTPKKRSLYDRNISLQSKDFQNLVSSLKEYSTIGIHPSYYSTENHTILQETQFLGSLSQNKITHSRQHFLRYQIPDTFGQLIDAGITDEYSMGFTDRVGFKNGIAMPFPFFNLKENKQTQLMLHPLLLMDCALYSQNLTENQYFNQVKCLVKAVREVEGEMVANWHNTLMLKGTVEEGLFKETFKLML